MTTTQPWEIEMRQLAYEFADSATDRDGNVDQVDSTNFNIAIEPLKSFITSTRLAAYHEGFDAGGHTVGGTGRIMYENGYAEGKRDTLREVLEVLDEEIDNEISTEQYLNAVEKGNFDSMFDYGRRHYRLAAHEIIQNMIKD